MINSSKDGRRLNGALVNLMEVAKAFGQELAEQRLKPALEDVVAEARKMDIPEHDIRFINALILPLFKAGSTAGFAAGSHYVLNRIDELLRKYGAPGDADRVVEIMENAIESKEKAEAS